MSKIRHHVLGAVSLFALSFALTPAQAADLGGDCCADLEARVAELEATTARKGNRKVSLEISGHVNRALLVWDDGQDSDAYIVDNSFSSSRVRFKGEGKIKEGWKAGFLIEVEFTDADSDQVSQLDDDARGEAFLFARHANWYIDSAKLGRITLGNTSSATDDLTKIDLGAAHDDVESNYAGGFRVRSNVEGVSLGSLNWNVLADGLDTDRGDFIRYDSPSLYGFILSAAWGENDIWDVALRYKKEWNSFKIAAGIGYYSAEDNNTTDGRSVIAGGNAVSSGSGAGLEREEFKGSLSVQHVPTGLFLTIAGGEVEYDEDEPSIVTKAEDAQFYYVEAGINKKFFSYGATVLYGLYGRYEDFGNGQLFTIDSVGATNDRLIGSEVDRYGFGVVQNFDSAAMEVYAAFNYYEANIKVDLANNGARDNVKTDEWMGVTLGTRIRF